MFCLSGDECVTFKSTYSSLGIYLTVVVCIAEDKSLAKKEIVI